MERLIDVAIFHIVPPDYSLSENAITLDRLSEIAHGLGEIISGLADERYIDETDDRQRSKPTKSAKDHYKVFVKPPVEGSFALPCELYDVRDTPENQDQLFDGEISFDTLAYLVTAVNEDNREGFYSAIPSPVVASKVLNGIEKIAPKNEEEVYFTYGRDQRKRESISEKASARIVEWQSLCVGPFEKEIIATISSVDFDNNAIRLKPLKSTRKFLADLDEEIASIPLGDVRNKKWKVLCDVTYTPNGMIDRISNVKGLEELELRELFFEGFSDGNRYFAFKTPLAVHEELDEETESLFVASIPELYINVYAEYQDELKDCILDELANKWSWIVECEDDDLTPSALKVKSNFLNMIEPSSSD